MAAREDGSFEEFVATRGAALLRTARLLCRVPDDAEDLCWSVPGGEEAVLAYRP